MKPGKTTEDKLRLQKLLANLNDMVHVMDSTGNVVYVSPSVPRVLGYSVKEFLGTNAGQYVHPGDMKAAMGRLQTILVHPGETSEPIEQRVRHKNGTYRLMEVVATNLLQDPAIAGIVVTSHDITKQAWAEARFRLLVENSQDIIRIMSPRLGATYVSPSVERVLGYTPEEFTKFDSLALVHPDDRKFINQMRDTIMARPGTTVGPIQERVRHKDGSWRWMDTVSINLLDTPGVEGIVSTSRDITGRKEAEEALELRTKDLELAVRYQEEARSEMAKLVERLKVGQRELAAAKAKDDAILQSIGEGLIAVDNDLRFMVVNKAAADMMGRQAKDLAGKSIASLHVEDEDGRRIALQERPSTIALTTGNIAKATYFFVQKDKVRLPIAVTATPIKFKGKIIGVIEIVRDITREKQVDKAKTEFVSLASHQLRTPLSSINWYSEMLLDGDVGKLNSEQKKYLAEVYKGSQRMVKLVNALLNVSRLELGTFLVEPGLINVPELARSVIDEQQPTINEKKLQLTASIASTIPPVQADPKFLRMVLQNLLSNAVKYTPNGGKVNLTITPAGKQTISIVISDTGCGIPKSQQDKIFGKLFRADNARDLDPDGTGLGLYIVKAIVDHSGGKISFESAENQGTTFHVSLPLASIKEKEPSQALV